MFAVRLRTPYGGYLGETYIQDNTFENAYLDMSSSSADGPQRVWIQRNTMIKCNSYNTGIYVSLNNYYSSGTPDSVRYVITDNVIRGQKGNYNTGYGIYLNASQNPVSLQISNNTLRANQYGIYVQSEKSSKAKIENNVIDSSYYDGIRLTRVSGKIQGNTITNNGWTSSWGVYLNSDFNYPGLDSVINNTIAGNGYVSSPNSTTTTPSRGGVSINGHTTAVMNNNNFVANNSFDVVNQVAESVVAQQNA
jgi:parallel beta-helix repeat protein